MTTSDDVFTGDAAFVRKHMEAAKLHIEAAIDAFGPADYEAVSIHLLRAIVDASVAAINVG